MKVLVIGGNGFIGSHIVDCLLKHGHGVRVFARHPEKTRAPLRDVEYVFGTFTDKNALVDAMVGVDAVFHLVSTTFPGTADVDPKADIQSNLIGAVNVVEAMQEVGLLRLLFVSSGGTVYGVPEQVPIPETHPLRPIGSYGIVKASIEHYLETYRRAGTLSPVIIRASNPYGPRQSHTGVQGVISTFLRKVLNGDALEIWGDGTVSRDYVEVSDLAELCVRAGCGKKEGPYNAGVGFGTSVNEIVDAIRHVTGVAIKPIYKPRRLIDVQTSVLDVSRAKNDFGWIAKTDLLAGLHQTWTWMLEESPAVQPKVRLFKAVRPAVI